MSLELLSCLKEFERLIKICRKQGVTEMTFGQVTVKLGELPSKEIQKQIDEEIPTEELTPEQLMFYAVNGPGNHQ